MIIEQKKYTHHCVHCDHVSEERDHPDLARIDEIKHMRKHSH